MSSSCQMYIAQQYTKFRFPVLPEKVEVAYEYYTRYAGTKIIRMP